MRHTLVFDTAFGRCALAWHDAGLTAVRLPDDEHHLLASLRRHAPGAQPWPADEPLPASKFISRGFSRGAAPDNLVLLSPATRRPLLS